MGRKSRRKQRGRIRAEPSGRIGMGEAGAGTSGTAVFSGDGYVNRPAFLGAASELFSAGTFVRSGLTQDTNLLTTVYRENWLAKKIIDMPAEDMTRAWYTLAADIPAVEMNALRRLEAKHSIQNEITNAIKWARLYGGSIAVMVIRGDEDYLDQPLDMDRLFPGCFQGILVLDRSQNVTPSMELEEDLDDPDFGLPKYYDISVDFGERSFLRVHHSRVLRFIGRELPGEEMKREDYWGASELEHIWEEIQKRSEVSANIAQLVFQANLTTLKMGNLGAVMATGADQQKEKIIGYLEEQNRIRTSFGLQVIGSKDEMQNHPYNFGGLSEVYSEFMMDMAGAAEIPATRLFGRSPQGMNSTGESDLINYYERIAQLQETYLRPALERLLPVMEMSAFGYVAEDAVIVFEPIGATTPEIRAEILSKVSSTIISLYNAGLISEESALAELKAQGREMGVFSRLKHASKQCT